MLGIFGIIAIGVLTYQNYRSAISTQRNGVLWAAVTAVIGIGFQFVVPVFAGIILAVYYLATGTPENEIEAAITWPAVILGIPCLILSIVGMVLVNKHVSKVKDDASLGQAPPPPPSFGING
jgi:hypothetical protein